MRSNGFTTLEAVVALAITSVVLGLVASYFSSQAQTTRQIQASNNVGEKVRSAMQLINVDLQQVGSSRYVDSNGVVSFNLDCSTSSHCLSASNGNPTTKDSLTLRYTTSLRDAASSCRRIDYGFSGDNLRRSDLACNASNADVAAALDDDNNTLADNILAVDIQYVCSNGNAVNAYPDNSNCSSSNSYARSAKVSVVGRSTNRNPDAKSTSHTTISGQQVVCPENYTCFSLTQEVLMPNMKNQ